MLQRNPNDRLRLHLVKAHPWFKMHNVNFNVAPDRPTTISTSNLMSESMMLESEDPFDAFMLGIKSTETTPQTSVKEEEKGEPQVPEKKKELAKQGKDSREGDKAPTPVQPPINEVGWVEAGQVRYPGARGTGAGRGRGGAAGGGKRHAVGLAHKARRTTCSRNSWSV